MTKLDFLICNSSLLAISQLDTLTSCLFNVTSKFLRSLSAYNKLVSSANRKNCKQLKIYRCH